jgi:hypothetical protein
MVGPPAEITWFAIMCIRQCIGPLLYYFNCSINVIGEGTGKSRLIFYFCFSFQHMLTENCMTCYRNWDLSGFPWLNGKKGWHFVEGQVVMLSRHPVRILRASTDCWHGSLGRFMLLPLVTYEFFNPFKSTLQNKKSAHYVHGTYLLWRYFG